MKPAARWSVALGVVGVFMLVSRASMDRDIVTAQTPKPVFVTRMYTGPDNLTHIEEVPAAFTSTNVFQLMKITGAELHRTAPGTVNNWHTAPRRQYVITLSGRGEIEASGGKKFVSEPGHIELAEDTTGKGHITRVLGSEERVTLWLPLAEQPAK